MIFSIDRCLQDEAECRRRFGPDDERTLQARSNLVAAYIRAGRAHDAIRPAQQLSTDRTRLLGAEHRDTLQARRNLEVAFGLTGRHREAIAECREIGPLFARALGPLHPHTVRVWDDMFEWQEAAQSWSAEDLDDQLSTLALAEATLGCSSLTAAALRRRAGVLFSKAGRPGQAADLFSPLVPTLHDMLGATHETTLGVRLMLGLALRSAQHQTEARRVLDALLPDLIAARGAADAMTLMARTQRSLCAYELGDSATAIIEMQELLALYTQSGRAQTAEAIAVRSGLCVAIDKEGDPQSAFLMLTDAIADAGDIIDEADPLYLRMRYSRACLRYKLGDAHAAGRELADIVDAMDRTLGSLHEDTLDAREMLATCYRAVGHHEKAEVQANRVARDRGRAHGRDDPRTRAAREAAATMAAGSAEGVREPRRRWLHRG